jgi:AraC-like DNA-binding protein
MNKLLVRCNGEGRNGSTHGSGNWGKRKLEGGLRAWSGNDIVVEHRGIARSLNFLRRNCCRPIGVGDLTKVAGLSRRGFLNAFQKHTGHTPGKVLRHLRIEQAKRLLVEQDMELEAIARRCGYRSVNTLWVAFREVTGVAPKKYQRQMWLMRWHEGLKDVDLIAQRRGG